MGFREVDLYLVCLLMLGSGWGGVVGWGCRGGVGWAPEWEWCKAA